MERIYKYVIEPITEGQPHVYADSYYSYKITSNRPTEEIKQFCMNILRKSYNKKEMPNLFSGELLKFEKLTNNKKKPFDSQTEETYLYEIREAYTG